MIADPIHSKIISKLGGLGGSEDGDPFQRCAVDLLKEIYPELLELGGGTDGGFDGFAETGEGVLQFISTVGADVARNVRRNLREGDKSRGPKPARRVLVATSRALSPRQITSIEGVIRDHGHIPLPVMSQQRLVPLFYRSPRWRKELLRITGSLPSLSSIPVSNRAFSDIPLVGRDEALNGILSDSGDLLLIGQPGTGKTFLLQKLATSSRTLFMISGDLNEAADQIREAPPEVIVVDDAYSRLDWLRSLRQLRLTCQADFRIVATCWPNFEGRVTEAFGGDRPQRLNLGKLSDSEIVCIARHVGIVGPNRLLREIVHQSDGKPGLAVTLCQALLRGEENSLEITLPQQAARLVTELGQKDGITALALFSLGGKEGISLQIVANALRTSGVTLQRDMEQLATGGIVEVRQDDRFVVTPQRLGQALVKQELFRRPAPASEVLEVIDASPSLGETLATLGMAKTMGGNVGDALMQSRLLRLKETKLQEHSAYSSAHDFGWYLRHIDSDLSTALKAYSQSGKKQCEWCLDEFPEAACKLAFSAFELIPDEYIRRLLDLAKSSQERGAAMKTIQSWLESAYPSTDEFVARRKLLLKVLLTWASRNSAFPDLIGEAMAFVFNVGYDSTYTPVGEENKVVISRGSATAVDRELIAGLWPKASLVIRKLDRRGQRFIVGIFHAWAFPDSFTKPMKPAEYRACRSHARALLRKYAEMMKDWATDHALHYYAASLKVPRIAPKDDLLDKLFPRRELGTDFEADWHRRSEVAHKLGRKLSNAPPIKICNQISAARESLATLNPTNSDDRTSSFLDGVFEETSHPDAWVEAILATKLNHLAGYGYFQKLAHQNTAYFEEILQRLMDGGHYIDLAAIMSLKHLHRGHRLWPKALDLLRRIPMLTEGPALRNEIHTTLYEDLLARGTDLAIRICVRIDPAKVTLPNDALDLWKEAMILQDEPYHTERIGDAFPNVRFRWLKRHLKEHYIVQADRLKKILSSLSEQERRWVQRNYGAIMRRSSDGDPWGR